MVHLNQQSANQPTMMISCKNCGASSSGAFCSACGQRTPIHPISWTEMGHQITHAVLHIEDGLLFTLRSLFLKPGWTIEAYLDGQRKKFYNPLLLLILVAGIGSLLFAHFHFQTIIASVELEKLETSKPFIAHKFFIGRLFLLCLICSVGDYFFFKEKKYNLPETLVSNFFMFSAVTTIQILFIPILLIGRHYHWGPFPGFLFLILLLSYLMWSRIQLYGAQKNFKRTLRIVLAVLFYFAVAWVIGVQLVKPALAS